MAIVSNQRQSTVRLYLFHFHKIVPTTFYNGILRTTLSSWESETHAVLFFWSTVRKRRLAGSFTFNIPHARDKALNPKIPAEWKLVNMHYYLVTHSSYSKLFILVYASSEIRSCVILLTLAFVQWFLFPSIRLR